MHRSRFSTLLIDASAEDAPRAAAFWSAALGVPARPSPDEPQFTSLSDPERGHLIPGLTLAIQAIDDAPRYHLDIETDDVEAETARLLALGATEVDRWLDCRILRVPGGHLLCVIPRHSDEETFDRLAHTWE
ncbi:MAG: VOC family protein [Actinoplanes sp.]